MWKAAKCLCPDFVEKRGQVYFFKKIGRFGRKSPKHSAILCKQEQAFFLRMCGASALAAEVLCKSPQL